MTVAAALREQVGRGVATRIFPAAVAEVGDSRAALWHDSFGTSSFDAGSPAVTERTAFDLASLTKPIATTTLTMAAVVAGRLALGDRVREFFPEWRGTDRDVVTIQDLLEHASGLAARLLDQPPGSRREFTHEICTAPLEVAPRTRAIYSDLGFILLGFLLEERGGVALDQQFAALVADLSSAVGDEVRRLTFRPGDELDAIAPTDPLPEDRRRRRLTGEVHDNYAAALGGVAGHAGLFGTAAAVGAFARAMLRARRGDETLPAPLSPASVGIMVRKSTVPNSSRALGWDTMLPTSSCGTHLSPAAFGHVGHTGTSLWIDPEADRYYVLLTNRVCGGGTSEAMQQVRRAFHDTASRL